MGSKKDLQSLSNGIFLAGTGLAVLLLRKIILTPAPRFIIAAIIAVWGFYLLASGSGSSSGNRSGNRTAGIMSLIASGLLIVFGGPFSGIAFVAGIGLIIAGGISFLSGLFDR